MSTPGEQQAPPKPNYDYGIYSEKDLSNLDLHLLAFKLDPPAEVGGKGRPFYFWKIVDLLWGEKSSSARKVFRHPWAERMIELADKHHYLAVHGCGSSGKTDTFALWGLVNWMADPMNTLVLATSTSLKDSRKRIWGSITSYYQAVPGMERFGHLIDSIGSIRSVAEDGSANNDKCGISLIPGERKKEKEAIGKIIGMKNLKVIMLADELPELSEALIAAAESNLSLNPFFQLIGLGNFNSLYDPLGVLCTPKNGWSSVNVEDAEWETKNGYCLHLDGTKSPNVIAGKDLYPRIYNSKNLADQKKRLGENSALFWRMCRSFPCPEGEKNCIYSDSDFILGDAHGECDWLDRPVPVCAADPGFTTEGDEFKAAHGLFGKNIRGLPTLSITDMETLVEDMQLTARGEARDIQTARQLTDHAFERGVSKQNLGLDSSGPGGLAFGSIVSMFWGNRFLPIKFGEVASDMVVSQDDPRKGCEAFVNLVSELWWMGKEFIRAGQIKGLPVDVARQLKARYYKSTKMGDFLKIKVEPKSEMKARMGESPDAADAVMMLIHLCRVRFGFSPGGLTITGSTPQPSNGNDAWMDMVRKKHSIYDPKKMFLGNAIPR